MQIIPNDAHSESPPDPAVSLSSVEHFSVLQLFVLVLQPADLLSALIRLVSCHKKLLVLVKKLKVKSL